MPPEIPERYGKTLRLSNLGAPPMLASNQVEFRLNALGYNAGTDQRLIWVHSPAEDSEEFYERWSKLISSDTVLTVDNHHLYSPDSTVARLSGHWRPNFVTTGSVAPAAGSTPPSTSTAETIPLADGKLYLYDRVLSTPFAAYGAITLSSLPGKRAVLRTLTGNEPLLIDVSTPTKTKGLSCNGTPAPANGLLRWSVQGQLSAQLEFGGSATVAKLSLSNVRILQPRTSQRVIAIARIANELEALMKDVSISTESAPAGLVVAIEVKPGRDYVVELRGHAEVGAPTLRVDRDDAIEYMPRYLSSVAGNLRFRAAAKSRLRLLLYQDSPFTYDVTLLQIRPAGDSDNAVADVFDGSVPLSRYTLP
jgi:hypothetical protein